MEKMTPAGMAENFGCNIADYAQATERFTVLGRAVPALAEPQKTKPTGNERQRPSRT